MIVPLIVGIAVTAFVAWILTLEKNKGLKDENWLKSKPLVRKHYDVVIVLVSLLAGFYFFAFVSDYKRLQEIASTVYFAAIIVYLIGSMKKRPRKDRFLPRMIIILAVIVCIINIRRVLR